MTKTETKTKETETIKLWFDPSCATAWIVKRLPDKDNVWFEIEHNVMELLKKHFKGKDTYDYIPFEVFNWADDEDYYDKFPEDKKYNYCWFELDEGKETLEGTLIESMRTAEQFCLAYRGGICEILNKVARELCSTYFNHNH